MTKSLVRALRMSLLPLLPAGALLIGWLDVHYGGAAPLRLLQLVPVLAAAWLWGWPSAMPLAVLAAAFTTLRPAVPLKFEPARWPEACVSFGMLAAAAVALALWREARTRELAARGTDALTGLVSRTAFEHRAAAELNRSRRTGRPLTAAFLDCDDFKAINDARGHLAGDDVLRTIAGVLTAGTRNYDVVARFGGDEFVLLLPESDAEAALAVLGRLQADIARALETRGGGTVSIGGVTLRRPVDSVDELLRASDEQMYLAKQAGKNALRHAIVEPPESR